MICPKCGTTKQSERCIKCGEILPVKETFSLEEFEPSDLEIFIGPNFDKILQHNYNITAMILGPFYFCYRKMFGLGFLLGLLQVTYFWYLSIEREFGYIGIVMTGIFPFLYLYGTNPLYLFISQIRIKKMREKYPSEIKKHLKKRGGTSLIYPVMNVCLYFFIIVLVFTLYQTFK